MNMQLRTILLGLLSLGFVQGYAQTFALQVKDDRITYLDDEQGNRILDFSYCGYKSSEQDIPDVRNTVFVSWTAGDNTRLCQNAGTTFFYAQSPDFPKPGLCYYLIFL